MNKTEYDIAHEPAIKVHKQALEQGMPKSIVMDALRKHNEACRARGLSTIPESVFDEYPDDDD